MKKTLSFFAVVLGILMSSSSQAQTMVRVETNDAVCRVALISDEDAAGGEYGWWSIWQDMSQTDAVGYAPVEFEVQPGTYTLVVYWENNNEQSDGIALEKIHIQRYITDINYSFRSDDFTEWNCLSCPWLCVFNGKEYVKHSEVLQDVTGYENRTTTSTQLDHAAIVDGKLRFRIQEEKNEVSYLDRVQLRVGEQVLSVTGPSAEKLAAIDDDFLVLKKDEMVELEISLPGELAPDAAISLEVSGYYHPEAEFLAEITNRLLKGKQ